MSHPASVADPQVPPPPGPDAPATGVKPRASRSPWAWMTAACVLLGASGGVRAWQDYRFATVLGETEAPPFRLTDLPKTLGNDQWRALDGDEHALDPEVARIAGSSDSVIRTYRNTRTGSNLTVLILFGPAQAVFGHTPEVCYPAAGYHPVDGMASHAIPCGDRPAAEFRSEVFARKRDERRVNEEVYYSFRHGDRWSPEPMRQWKDFRHHPSMFKVQVQRPTLEGEDRARNNPSEQFLALLLPEIERRLASVHGEE
jgi:hypothetical protein